jgi:hypothetical protein
MRYQICIVTFTVTFGDKNKNNSAVDDLGGFTFQLYR